MNTPTFDPATLPGAGIKPLLSLRRHPRAALLVALLVVLAGLPVAWFKGLSHFNSEAVFQVAPSYMKNLTADKELELQSNSQYREFVNHLSNTVTRPDVLQRAVAALRERGIDRRPPAMTERKYIEFLARTLYVRAVPDTYMVRIGADSQEPAHLHDLINAVADSFVQTTREEQIYGSPERLKALQERGAELASEVATLGSQRIALAERLGLTTFADSTVNPYDTALALARERLEAARLDRAQAEAALASFLAHRELPGHLGRSLLEMRLQDNGLQALRNEVVARTEQLNRIMAGLEPRHPARQAAEAELADMQRRLSAGEAAFDRGSFDSVRARLVAGVDERRQVESSAQAAHAQLQAQATDFARSFQQAMRLTADIRERDAELQRVRERLGYLDLETQALGFVRLVSPALPAETPLGVGHKKMILAVLLAGLAAGLAAPVVLDLLDRRIRTVNEAEKLMGIPAAGWQVHEDGMASEALAQEQVRRFASTLVRNRARGGRNLFGFTGIKPGAGASRSVQDTARELGRLGFRTLVIDTNAMTPGTASVGVPGLTDLLAGEARFEGLARPVVAGHVDGVAIGTRPDQGLQRLDLLRQALDRWCADYDFVLCDLAPLLLSADAELMIEQVGQVFLVIDAEAASRGEIARARRLLQRLDPEAVGLYVNRVPVFRGAGYYEPLIVETLLRTRFERFMSQSGASLSWQLARARLARWWSQRRRPAAA
ncbi:MAG: hypothetical protein H6933_07645 [Burkholderiaceae bacterium]|nr:hypothetical protein [Rhodoferax sp.]MCP5284754.1 hypothetical protein [Burkholderiaceae bacterium]